MSQQTSLHSYNNEFTQCIEELCHKRDDLKREILDDETEKQKLENDIAVLSQKIAKVNENLCSKINICNEFDRIISENEAAYMKEKSNSTKLYEPKSLHPTQKKISNFIFRKKNRRNVFSLECYQCDSIKDLGCNSQDFSKSILPTKCPLETDSYCIKEIGYSSGIVSTKRYCSYSDRYNICKYITLRDHDRKYRSCIYTCDFEACNSFSPKYQDDYQIEKEA
ncbi:deflagellation-inducible protein [Intoshia linei]|uniref:Deflagellation-inducible protein n=1 Tax=Intoshia linei TaxID=1819745 RepID=A0A177B9E7_9BILA|nr:deflagellation-inducible protein [Intoshia linei]